MTARFKPPIMPASERQVALLRADGRTVLAVPGNELVIRIEATTQGRFQKQRVVEIEWPGGPCTAAVVGTSLDGQALYVDLGHVVGRGRQLAEGLSEAPEQARRWPRVKRTGRRLPWWAARIVWRKGEPVGLAKET